MRTFAADNEIWGDPNPGVYKQFSIEYEVTYRDGSTENRTEVVGEFGESFDILPDEELVEMEYIPKQEGIVIVTKALWGAKRGSIDVRKKLSDYYRNAKREFWGSNDQWSDPAPGHHK